MGVHGIGGSNRGRGAQRARKESSMCTIKPQEIANMLWNGGVQIPASLVEYLSRRVESTYRAPTRHRQHAVLLFSKRLELGFVVVVNTV